MPLEVLIAGILLIALTIYGLSGGADFGAGVWDLLASGPRAAAQRELIAKAIAPIWEANNVWLVLLVVVLFTGFPAAFAAILTALNIPLSIMLVGIVLRGAAFAFRSHTRTEPGATRGAAHNPGGKVWGRLFAIGSIVTPVMLGVCLGALSSGSIRVENGVVTSGFFRSWLTPFTWAVGALALALFAYLAALYLAAEAPATAPVRADFRRRAAAAGIAAALLAALVYGLALDGAPRIAAGLTASPWALLMVGVTTLTVLGALWALRQDRVYLARALGVAQVVFILWGWAAGQYPYLVVPDLTLQNTAAPAATLRLLLIALVAGAVVLFPSFYYLYRVFKGPAAFLIRE
ncbi:MAG: cytochrome d ubiquinol oxidase subunit II [Anaerolineales bacterium]